MPGAAHPTVIRFAPGIHNARRSETADPSSSSTIEGLAITATAGLLVALAAGVFLLRSTRNTITARRLVRGRRSQEQFRQKAHETDLRELRGILDAIASRMFALWTLVNEAYGILGTACRS